jgi:transcription antitermination factor NusG
MFADWKVIYTHPRAEKMAALDCRAIGLEHYLPLRSATRVYQRRKVTFLTPLFPGYVFVDLPGDMKGELLSRGHVVRIIPVVRPLQMLRQVAMVRKVLRADPGVEAVDPVAEGEVVRVSSGPMQGCEGVVTRIGRKSGRIILTISVDIVGKAIPLQIERGLIERLVDSRTHRYRLVSSSAAQ